MNLPTSGLWDGTALRLPRSLKDLYRSMLLSLGLLDRAIATEDGGNPVGGLSDEETLEHFARRFGVSSCRLQAVLLAVNSNLAAAAKDICSTVSDGEIRILDIPCGSGVASATLLLMIAELRRLGVFPRTPLNVEVLGGDYSPKARHLFAQLMREVSVQCASCGIQVSSHSLHWDATRGDSTALLMNEFLDERKVVPNDFLVLITNFSGETGRQAFFEQFQPNLEQILARLAAKRSTLLWVEPKSDDATSVLGRLLGFLQRRIPWISMLEGATGVDAEYSVEHPIRLDIHRSGMKLLRHHRR